MYEIAGKSKPRKFWKDKKKKKILSLQIIKGGIASHIVYFSKNTWDGYWVPIQPKEK